MQSFSWLWVEERGDDVVLVCTSCPLNSAWARGKIAKANMQQSELVHHVESVMHKKGLSCTPIIQGLREMSRRAAARDACAAEKSARMSYSSWPIHAAKIAHLINKRALSFSVMGDLCTIVRECDLGVLEQGVSADSF